MKKLKSIPLLQSELDKRRFWEMNDAANYFDLDGASRGVIRKFIQSFI